MTNNKGYTLVELLVSIAIFSVVSVGVVYIMSNTLGAYKTSSFEVEAQENAQIVANQLEEFLCDANGPVSGSISSGLSFNSQGQDYTLTYAGDEISVSTDGGSSYQTLADNISSFEIVNNSASDNKVTVKLGVDVEGQTYNLERDIYYRNHVENSDFNNIKYLKSEISTPGPTPDPDEKTVVFNRYDSINLSSEYGINYLSKGTAKGGFTDGSGVCNDTLSNAYFSVSASDNTLTSDTSDKIFVLEGTSTMNSTFNNALIGNTVKFVGYKDKDCTQKVTLNFEVKDIAFLNDNNVYQHPKSHSTNNGLHTVIGVEGIDVNKAIAAGVVFKYTPKLSNGTNTYSGSLATMSKATTIDKGTNSIQNIPYGNKEVILGLQPDPYGNGIILSSSNETANSKCDGFAGNEDSYELSFDFSVKNGSTTVDYTDQMKMKFDILSTGF